MRLRSALGRGAVTAAAGFSLWGCGAPNPRILDSTEQEQRIRADRNDGHLSEPEKIRRLIQIVRESEHTFIQGGQERNGEAAAADLERRLARVPAGIPTAKQFVDRVGAGRLRAKEPDMVRLADGATVSARDWLLARLDEIEGRTPGVLAATEPDTQRTSSTELGILDALTIVERSGLRFVAPARRTPKGKLKGKRKEYTSTEFAEMLRKKWEFLGADIHDLDTFIEEIASDSFSTMEPYRVMHPDGQEEEFRPWLLTQLETRRQALAKGGAP